MKTVQFTFNANVYLNLPIVRLAEERKKKAMKMMLARAQRLSTKMAEKGAGTTDSQLTDGIPLYYAHTSTPN